MLIVSFHTLSLDRCMRCETVDNRETPSNEIQRSRILAKESAFAGCVRRRSSWGGRDGGTLRRNSPEGPWRPEGSRDGKGDSVWHRPTNSYIPNFLLTRCRAQGTADRWRARVARPVKGHLPLTIHSWPYCPSGDPSFAAAQAMGVALDGYVCGMFSPEFW